MNHVNQVSPTDTAQSYAAIDLGSNSFHMVVAQAHDQRLQIIDNLKEMVRLAAGLGEDNRLSDEAVQRGLECLQRFSQRMREIPQSNIRVVGTNTLRQAKNGALFLHQAKEILGHRVDIIAGREEARLVYLGVAHSMIDDDRRRLVMDIGGGSTEYVVGQHFKPLLTESLHLGCVSWSQRFFPGGKITAKRFKKAEIAARIELEAIRMRYLSQDWDIAIGSSGTAIALESVMVAQGWSTHGITLEGLRELKKYLLETGSIEEIKLEGLKPERLPVIAGGLAVMFASFKVLDIEFMETSKGALREGLLHDMLGRRHHQDIRDTTVSDVKSRFSVDLVHAERVAICARRLFDQARDVWKLEDDHGMLLDWAANLHEVGLDISHSQYHKHGAYILSNMDMPGFSRQEQQLLGVMIRAHRRKLKKEIFSEMPSENPEGIVRLSVLLRLAVLLHRSRGNHVPETLTLHVTPKAIHIVFDENWLAEHSLTQADLEREQGYLSSLKVDLSFG